MASTETHEKGKGETMNANEIKTEKTPAEIVQAELEQLGYKVNGDTWQWNVTDENGAVSVSDGQQSATVDGILLADKLARLREDDLSDELFAEVWTAINNSEIDLDWLYGRSACLETSD